VTADRSRSSRSGSRRRRRVQGAGPLDAGHRQPGRSAGSARLGLSSVQLLGGAGRPRARSQLADAGLSLIRQLEHRVQTLPNLAARLDHERIEALRETAAARDQLARPFKYADQLADAHRQQEHIGEQIADRHHEHQDAERTAAIAGVDADTAASIALAHRAHPQPAAPAAGPTPALAAHGEPPAAGDRDLEPETAESLRLLRATQAKPIEEALRSPAAANPAARNLTHAPPRSSRPRR
jgi:hypothetical protein